MKINLLNKNILTTNISDVINDKEISFSNYIRLVDLYEFYKEGNQYQFGEYIEPLMNELSNYVSYSFSTSSNSDKPYVKK